MPRLAVLLLVIALTATCGPRSENLAERLACAPALGIDELLSLPESAHILLDGDSTVAQASQAIACTAAARGEHVAFAAAGDGADRVAAPVRQLAANGAAVDIFPLPTAAADANLAHRTPEAGEQLQGEARNAAFAQQVSRHGAEADRVIVVVDTPDGSRGRVGLSGTTWRPLGARLPEGRVVSLRVEAVSRPGIRIQLIPFEDVPLRGAALRYDGTVEVGPPAEQAARQSPPALRSR